MLRPSERTASRCSERCTPPTTTPSAATSGPSGRPPAAAVLFVSLCCQAPGGFPSSLVLVSLVFATYWDFSSLCHPFYLSSAVWHLFCRDVCTLEGRAPEYCLRSNLRSQRSQWLWVVPSMQAFASASFFLSMFL